MRVTWKVWAITKIHKAIQHITVGRDKDIKPVTSWKEDLNGPASLNIW